MSHSRGGIIPGPHAGTVLVTIEDDECVLAPRTLVCQRNDDRHNYEMVEAPRRVSDPEPEMVRGRCLHRPCHVVPVESGGEIVAHLCRSCDRQLP